MSTAVRPLDAAATRMLADQAFSRTAGAPLVHGNDVRILKDAAENYPAWLDAIAGARETIHFESYIIHDDDVGRRFADALIAKAAAGVRVRVVYDWLGGICDVAPLLARAARRRRGGAVLQPAARWTTRSGWLARDHRKCVVVDGAWPS